VTQKPVRAEQETPLALAPWSWRHTIVGTTLTLVPWLTLAIGSQAASGSGSQATARAPSMAADAAAGVAVFVLSAVIEAVFLLAPLYFALTLPVDDAQTSDDRPWRTRWRLATQALGMSKGKPSGATADGHGASPWRAIWLTTWVSALALGASAFYSLVIGLTHIPLKTNADALAKQAHTAPLTTLGALLAAILVAPLCEEIFFRGFVFPGLLRRLSLWPAMTLSALLFALAHADLGSFLPLALIGLALAYLRWRTRSLWPCVALHTLNNLVAAALLAPALFPLIR